MEDHTVHLNRPKLYRRPVVKVLGSSRRRAVDDGLICERFQSVAFVVYHYVFIHIFILFINNENNL